MNLNELKTALDLTPEDRMRIDRAACTFKQNPATCKLMIGHFCRSQPCQYHDKERAMAENDRIASEKARRLGL